MYSKIGNIIAVLLIILDLPTINQLHLIGNYIIISDMEMVQKANYLNAKFTLDNLKRQKDSILHNAVTFSGYDLIGTNKNILIKEFYDTPDFFLLNAGISVNINTLKKSKTSELVVRWNKGYSRIQFLKNLPDTFTMSIPSKASIYKYTNFIAQSISELVPQGQGVDPMVIASALGKIFTVKKTRESFRYIHISGCKVTIDFSDVEFTSATNHKKSRTLLLEISSDSLEKTTEYDEFIKRMSFNNTQLIKTHSSDVEIAKEYGII